MKKIIIVLLACLAASAPALETSLGIKSAIVPGMGQLSAGFGSVTSKNTLKGLGIMTGFTLCMGGLLNNISERESYAEQTKTYAARYAALQVSGNFADASTVYTSWTNANNSYNSANTAMYIFLGLSLAVYGYGIVDALMYTTPDNPQGQEGPASLLVPQKKVQFQCARVNGRSGVRVNYSF